MLNVIEALLLCFFISPLFFAVGRQSLELRIAESRLTHKEVSDFLRNLGFPLNRIYARPSWVNSIAQKPGVDIAEELIRSASQKTLAFRKAARFLTGAFFWAFMLFMVVARLNDAALFPGYLLFAVLFGGNFIFFWRLGRELKRKSSDGES